MSLVSRRRATRFLFALLHLVVNYFVSTWDVRRFHLLPSLSNKQGWQTTVCQEEKMLQTSRHLLNFSCPPKTAFGALEHVHFRSFPPCLRLVHSAREGTSTFTQLPHCPEKCWFFFFCNLFFYVSWYLYFVEKTLQTSLFVIWAFLQHFGSNKLTCSSALPISIWKVFSLRHFPQNSAALLTGFSVSSV